MVTEEIVDMIEMVYSPKVISALAKGFAKLSAALIAEGFSREESITILCNTKLAGSSSQ